MDFDENPEHAAIREAVAKIAAPFGGSYYTEHAEQHTPTDELWRALGRQGFIGINIPERFGGGGAGLAELALVCEETAAQGAPLLLLLVSSAISAEVLARYGSEEQRQTWLPGLASGESKVVFAITEPNAGSNTHQISTTARRDGDDWVLNGTKYYISGVNEADALVVVARTGEEPATGKGLMSLFLVPTHCPGLVANELPVSVSLPEKQFTLFFDDVRLPAGALIGVQNEGFTQVFHGLNPERITGAAICVGVGRRALALASEYARNREVWGISRLLRIAPVSREMVLNYVAQHSLGLPRSY